MLSVFIYSFNAVMPLLLLVLVGYILKRKGIFTKEWLAISNKFNFRFCLSALLFCNMYSLEGLSSIDWALGLFIIVSLSALTVVGFIIILIFKVERNRKGVMVQAALRSNYSFVGLSLAQSMNVPGGLEMVSAMQAPAVIFFNLMAVVALSIFSDDKKPDFKKILKNIITNPLILALLAGLAVLIVREFIPRDDSGELVFSLQGSLPFVYSALNNLSKIATPLSLIVLGGQFELSSVKGMKREITVGVVSRLVIAPIVGFALAFAAGSMGFLSLTPAAVTALITLYGTPAATSGVVMASEMGADSELAGQIVVWTTIFSLLTLFLQIAGFRYAGMI